MEWLSWSARGLFIVMGILGCVAILMVILSGISRSTGSGMRTKDVEVYNYPVYCQSPLSIYRRSQNAIREELPNKSVLYTSECWDESIFITVNESSKATYHSIPVIYNESVP